jgi:hypothetical protein
MTTSYILYRHDDVFPPEHFSTLHSSMECYI